MTFKPTSFFRANPSLDVPAGVNKHSVAALKPAGGNTPMSEAATAGKDCCGSTKL